MKKGEIYTGIVERMDFPNKGIVWIDGEPVIVKNALPGQRIAFKVNKKKGGRCEGRLLEVVDRSLLESGKTMCPHFGTCGGCLSQSLPYEEQLKIKERQVKDLLSSVCRDYIFEGIKASPVHVAYRNKMEYSFGDESKNGPLALGLHRRGSFYDVVNTDHCQIVHDDFLKILTASRHYFSDHGVGFYHKLSHEGYLRHLVVRRAMKTGEILAMLVTTGQSVWKEAELLEGWKRMLLDLPLEGIFAGILHICNDSLADVVWSDETTILYGQDYFYEELLGMKFKISPFSFFQTNSLGAEVLYEVVRQYVGDTKGKVVYDLYSGTGTIAQILAPVAEKVIGVEIVEEAVKMARDNAARNGLANCEFAVGDVWRVIDSLRDKPDLVVLDPPRDGLHPKALDKLCMYIRAERIVYISCKPTSLIRDLQEFQDYGYRVERSCCVDMFPGTGNIETVCLLSNRKSKPDSYYNGAMN